MRFRRVFFFFSHVFFSFGSGFEDSGKVFFSLYADAHCGHGLLLNKTSSAAGCRLCVSFSLAPFFSAGFYF